MNDEVRETLLNLATLREEWGFTQAEAVDHLRRTAATLFGSEDCATENALQLMAQLVQSFMGNPLGSSRGASRGAALKYFGLMAQTMREHGPGEPAHYAFEQLLDDAEEKGEKWALEIGQVFKRQKRSGT